MVTEIAKPILIFSHTNSMVDFPFSLGLPTIINYCPMSCIHFVWKTDSLFHRHSQQVISGGCHCLRLWASVLCLRLSIMTSLPSNPLPLIFAVVRLWTGIVKPAELQPWQYNLIFSKLWFPQEYVLGWVFLNLSFVLVMKFSSIKNVDCYKCWVRCSLY